MVSGWVSGGRPHPPLHLLGSCGEGPWALATWLAGVGTSPTEPFSCVGGGGGRPTDEPLLPLKSSSLADGHPSNKVMIRSPNWPFRRWMAERSRRWPSSHRASWWPTRNGSAWCVVAGGRPGPAEAGIVRQMVGVCLTALLPEDFISRRDRSFRGPASPLFFSSKVQVGLPTQCSTAIQLCSSDKFCCKASIFLSRLKNGQTLVLCFSGGISKES